MVTGNEGGGVCGVIPADLAAGPFWPGICAQIRRALPYGRGECDAEDIRVMIERGEMVAIGAIGPQAQVECVAVCAVARFPKKRVLCVQYAAGLGGGRLLDVVVSAAQKLGCDWIEARCRPAVARLFRRHGFDVDERVVMMEINP